MPTEDEQRARIEAGAGAPDEPEGAAPAETGRPEARPGHAGAPAHGAVRYTRRRVLILGAAFAAGVAAVVAGIRALGGPSEVAEKVGGPVADQFGTFPVRSVESVPDVPPEQWVVTVDGLVETPLTVDHALWSTLPRARRDRGLPLR